MTLPWSKKCESEGRASFCSAGAGGLSISDSKPLDGAFRWWRQKPLAKPTLNGVDTGSLFFQNYDPFSELSGSGQPGLPVLGTMGAALPVVVLFSVLLLFKARIWKASIVGFAVAVAVALGAFRMPGSGQIFANC